MDGKTRLRVISKLVLLLVVIGFFMPVSCNLNGFELASIPRMEAVDPVHSGAVLICALMIGGWLHDLWKVDDSQREKPILGIIKETLPRTGIVMAGLLILALIPEFALSLPKYFLG
jgi:TRAP-type C4-dicarboxylate transport system permease large subunit